MTSIILRELGPDSLALAACMEVEGHLHLEHIAILERKDGEAIQGQHTGIGFLIGTTARLADVEKQDLVIERVPDRAPGTAAWQMRIGGELAMRLDRRDGVRKPIRLTDAAVNHLAVNARVVFADGEPDWDLRHVEILEDKVHDLEEVLLAARQRAEAARGEWAANRSAEGPGIA